MVSKDRFWDAIAEKYAARPVGNEEAYEQTLERVRHWLQPDWRVLEIGCGTGTTALKLAGSAASVLGTDISAEMVRIARGKAAEAGVDHVQFEMADTELAGTGRAFDAVMGFNILHLVDDLEATLSHVRGLLPVGGVFISKTPCLGGQPWFRPLIWGMQRFGKAPPVVHYLRPAQIQNAITAAGFEIVETGDYPRRLRNHFIVARAV